MARPALAVHSGPTDQHAGELSHFNLSTVRCLERAARIAFAAASGARHALLNRLLPEGHQDQGGIPMSVPVPARRLHQPPFENSLCW